MSLPWRLIGGSVVVVTIATEQFRWSGTLGRLIAELIRTTSQNRCPQRRRRHFAIVSHLALAVSWRHNDHAPSSDSVVLARRVIRRPFTEAERHNGTWAKMDACISSQPWHELLSSTPECDFGPPRRVITFRLSAPSWRRLDMPRFEVVADYRSDPSPWTRVSTQSKVVHLVSGHLLIRPASTRSLYRKAICLKHTSARPFKAGWFVQQKPLRPARA